MEEKRPVQRPKNASAPALPQKRTVPERKKSASPAPVKQERGGLLSLFQKKNDPIGPGDVIRVRSSVDRPMLLIVLALFCLGCVMVFSASYSLALKDQGDSYYYIKRHLAFGTAGLVAMAVAAHFDYRWIRKLVIPLFLGTAALLGAVRVYGMAQGVAQRWIAIGPITIQPSEIMKLALVLALAAYMARYQDEINDYSKFGRSSLYGNLLPFIILAVAAGFVMIQPHLSGAIIIGAMGCILIFAGGGRKLGFVVLLLFALAAIFAITQVFPYMLDRVDSYLNFDNYWTVENGFADKIEREDIDAVWQTVQSLIAVGSGGIFGVGLGNSVQKHSYLPMPHNDFIFAIVCEELGLIGALCVILLFVLFIWRGFVIARRAPDTFSSLVVIGITAQVGLQAMLNIMVVTNLIPNTGVSLPFFSYGGTSLMMLLGEMGIVLSISRFSYQKQ